jgi:hypothetical protein
MTTVNQQEASAAFVWPTLELFFTALPATLIKKHDPETDLAHFDLDATS